jgi:hypothetical protein
VSERTLYDLECVLIALLAGAYVVRFVYMRLRRSLPDLSIGRQLAVGFGARMFAALIVSSTSYATQLRGGDEYTFISRAKSQSGWDLFSTGTIDGFTKQFHVEFLSFDYRFFDRVPDMMLRTEVIAISICGLMLLAAAVHVLAGRRAAVVAAWILALEPASIFFSGIVHKEPFMLLAEGMVAYGGAKLWKTGRFTSLIPMILGCLLASATRPYVGWFLAFASAAVALHVGLRRRSIASFGLITVIVALGVAFFPAVWNASSEKKLHSLQLSQNANAADTSSNLSLERVDYSTRGKILVNLPKRVLDIATKPYPWQMGNTSQQLGVLGTMTLFIGFLGLISTLLKDGRRLFRRAGPLIYPLFFLTVAYSLSAGNAGTAFRYRTHLVAFLFALVCTLRETRAQPVAPAVPRPSGRLQPVFQQAQSLDRTHVHATR